MNNPIGTSLRRQLLFRLWGPLLVVLSLGAFAAFAVARHVGYLVHDRWLYDSAMTLAAQLKLRDDRYLLDLPRPAVEMFEWDSLDRIYEEVVSRVQGRIFSNAVLPEPPAPLAINDPLYYDATIAGQPVRVIAIALPPRAGVDDTLRVQVAETTHKRESVAREVIWLSVPLQAAVLIIAGTLVWLAVTRTLRRVDQLAARIASYDPEGLQPVSETEEPPSEIKPLINAINGLIAKLHEAQDTQRRFIANAAHQLRTPLASLQVQTQRTLRENDPSKHAAALTDVLAAVTRLRHVAHQLLTLTRSERASERMLQMTDVDLAEIAREELEQWTNKALARDIDLGYEGPEQGVRVHGEPHLLRELMGNLIDNALRYSERGGKVTLALTSSPTTLRVDDEGPGIPAEDRALVLERFYRRAGAPGEGCGLGLPIAQEIAARHHARLNIVNPPEGRGTRVEIVFEELRKC